MNRDSNEMNSRLVKRGKVKDVYDVGEDLLLFVFSDRISAYDVILPSKVPKKGEVLCKFAQFWFEHLGVPNHMVSIINSNKMTVRKLRMIPIECVVRGYVYGSLFERGTRGEVNLPVEPVMAARLPEPLFDPTTKLEEKDRPIKLNEIVERGWLTHQQFEQVRAASINIYDMIAKRVEEAGFILADLKLEFGWNDKEILLADSIGPDEFRLWPKEKYSPGRAQESYDKQPIRDWLSRAGYKAKLDEAAKKGLSAPPPPIIPDELIEETSLRYIHAYERITGIKI